MVDGGGDEPGGGPDQEILINRAGVAQGVHVLIVCVADNEGRQDPLPGAVETAKRLVTFWSSCAFDKRVLSSLDILISHKEPVEIVGDDPAAHKVRTATHAAVKDAFGRWAERVTPGSLAILHWIGHGSRYAALSGQSNLTGLFCSDLDDEGELQAYDMHALINGVSSRLLAPSMIFVDACRSYPDARNFNRPASYAGPFEGGGRARYWPEIYHLNDLSGSTYCAAPEIQLGPEMGGAFMTEALLHGLKGIGAIKGSDGGGHPVMPRELAIAADFLVRMLMRNHAISTIQPNVIKHDPGQLSCDRAPVVLAPRQRGVKTIDGAGTKAEDVCIIKDASGDLVTPSPWKAPRGWEVHLDFAANYRAHLGRHPSHELEETGVPFDVDRWDCNNPVKLLEDRA